MATTFDCASCDETFTASFLSRASLKKSGADRRTRAIGLLALQDRHCEYCVPDDERPSVTTSSWARQRYSGINLGQLEMQWLALNY